jgi:hypothetical protein
VFLDGAAHQPTQAIEAWAELIQIMFEVGFSSNKDLH